jgi:hypothetical protein
VTASTVPDRNGLVASTLLRLRWLLGLQMIPVRIFAAASRGFTLARSVAAESNMPSGNHAGAAGGVSDCLPKASKFETASATL